MAKVMAVLLSAYGGNLMKYFHISDNLGQSRVIASGIWVGLQIGYQANEVVINDSLIFPSSFPH